MDDTQSTTDAKRTKTGRTPLPSSIPRHALPQSPSLPKIAPRPAADERRASAGSGVKSSAVSSKSNANMPLHPKPPNSDTTGALHSYVFQQQQQKQKDKSQRKPLPSSPQPQSLPQQQISDSQSPPRFKGQLPSITSLLPPTAQYPPPLSPSQERHGRAGPLAPPAHMVLPDPGPMPPAPHGLPGPYSLPSIATVTGSSVAIPRAEGGVNLANTPLPQERPFKCDLCTQSFSRNHDLKRHRRIHLASKPYPCPNCDKAFSRKDALKRHSYVKACSGKRSNPDDAGPSSVGDDGDDDGDVDLVG